VSILVRHRTLYRAKSCRVCLDIVVWEHNIWAERVEVSAKSIIRECW